MALLISHASASEHRLVPMVGLGPPIDEGVTVAFDSPNGWVPRTKTKYLGSPFVAVFALAGHADEEHPLIDLSVKASVLGKLDPHRANLLDPKMSQTAADIETFAPIQAVQNLEEFDAGKNGKLPIWKLQQKSHSSQSYTYFLVLFSYKHVGVEICLKGKDVEKPAAYLRALKEIARSVRFNQR